MNGIDLSKLSLSDSIKALELLELTGSHTVTIRTEQLINLFKLIKELGGKK